MRIIQPEAHILPVTGDILKHVERCGRIAYKSENAISDGSAVRFIQNIIKRGHESVLEHGNYVFLLPDNTYEYTIDMYTGYEFGVDAKDGISGRIRFSQFNFNSGIVSGNVRAWRDFIRVVQRNRDDVPAWMCHAFYDNPAFEDLGLEFSQGKFMQLQREDLTPKEADIHWTETAHFICSRAISHELVRHRALSPTQESQRFCNYSKGKFGGEITFIEPLWVKDSIKDVLWRKSMQYAEADYLHLINSHKMQPQEAREVLPNSTKTELVMTGTLGEWKHFFALRCAPDAHPEMRRIAIPLQEKFETLHRGECC